MKVNFHKPLSSYVTTIVLLLIYAVALAAATFSTSVTLPLTDA